MFKLKEKLLYVTLSTALITPFLGSGIKVTWAAGGITKNQAIGSITATLVNIIGGGHAADIKNIAVFALGKAGNYANWWELAWSIIDLATAFTPGSMGIRLAASAGKLVATL